jgi:hypothetical protein
MPRTHGRQFRQRGTRMTDLVMLATGTVFFAVALAYVFACDRL